jgi:hypothetical protein
MTDDYLMPDGRLTSEAMERVMTEVALGIPAERSRLPDHPAVRAFRERIEAEMATWPKGTILDYGGAEFPG